MATLNLSTICARVFELDQAGASEAGRFWIASKKDMRDLFYSVYANECLSADVAGLIQGRWEDFAGFRFIIKD